MPSLSAALARLLRTGSGFYLSIIVCALGIVAMMSGSTELRLLVYMAVVLLTVIGVSLHRRGQFPPIVHFEMVAGLAAAVAAACARAFWLHFSSFRSLRVTLSACPPP
jgi:hypothetical protein